MLKLYEENQQAHILALLSQSIDLSSLCSPEIVELWSSGSEKNQELVKCLYAYSVNGKNLAETAKSMHIHRNTLIYRLSKIASILGEDLYKMNDRKAFFYVFSCLAVMSTGSG